jgi:mono/diheme cytochrome c family protein
MKKLLRHALALGCLLLTGHGTAAADETGVTYLDQGWDAPLREAFYFTPQGSRMIPARWFVALETDDQNVLLSAPENLTRYGFIYSEGDSPLNPHKLPIGFAVDTPIAAEGVDPIRGASLGLTCAACHTADVTVGGKRIRIDGAPANLDMDRFYSNLSAAVDRTFFDADAFQRFAARVLETPTAETIGQLRQAFADYHARLRGDAVIRNASLESGFGRVDALTQIVNALAVSGQKEPSNLVAVNAPTSYPHLWLTPQLEFVQWNPIASSPMARNGGQVLGVFGDVNLDGPAGNLYDSSLLIKNLALLEQWVDQLKPPAWDEATFGAIEADRVNAGKQLFDQHCVACHNVAPYQRTDPSKNAFGKTFIKIGRTNYRKVGTDPLYVQALTRRLVRTNEVTKETLGGKALVPALQFFLGTVGPVVKKAMDRLELSNQEQVAMHGFRFQRTDDPSNPLKLYQPSAFDDLKAGPLAGIWATGPFLHNGSVPTVYELLSPVNERPSVFWTGGRELDRSWLGFKSGDAPGRFRFDTSKSGNGNGGHVYPPKGLSEAERLAIIEYLKTL